MDNLAAAVDEQRLMDHCAEFARRVKLSGSADEMSSMHRMRAVLGSYGYKVRLLSHAACISSPAEGTVIVDGAPFAAITHSPAWGSPPTKTLAETTATIACLIFQADGDALREAKPAFDIAA